MPTITEELDPLFTYTKPLLPRSFEDLEEEGRRRYLALYEQHAPLGVLLFVSFTTYQQFLGRDLPALPLRGRIQEDGIRAEVLDAPDYRELLEVAVRRGHEAIAEFRALRPPDRQ
jgi:hypothetical protein